MSANEAIICVDDDAIRLELAFGSMKRLGDLRDVMGDPNASHLWIHAGNPG